MKGLKLYIRYWGARVLFFGFFAFLIAIVFFFRIQGLNIWGLTLTNPLYIYTIEIDWWLYLIMYFIIVFFINTILFILFTVYIRYNKIQTKKMRTKYEHIITDKITTIIYEEIASSSLVTEKSISELKSLIDKDYAKIILLDILRKIHSQAKDEVRVKALDILEKLLLNDFIKTYLHSPYFRDKIFAMKIISEFELGMRDVHQFESNEFHDYIIRLTRSKNYVLRTEAFISLIKLAMHDDLSFLLDRELHVSIWDMNVVLKIFRDIKNNNINYSKLIESDSPRVAALGILLANKHNRTELKELIFTKIGSKDGLLNYEAYSAYISMAENDSDYKFLTEKFSRENYRIKRSIVQAFSNCPSVELAKTFLKYVIKEESLMLKVDAMKLLIDLDVNMINEYKHSADLDIITARKHIVDFNLN